MIKLKMDTFYYIYTNKRDYFLSDIGPILVNDIWVHPEFKLKATGELFRTRIPRMGENVTKVFRDVVYEKEM